MALGKDGNSKHSTSFKPYDTSNSFVRKITDRVSGLIGWRTNSYDSGGEQNHENSPSTSLTDDETVSPIPKRIKIQRDADEFKFTPKPAPNDGCNSMSQINDISIAGPSYRNKCVASSTPAVSFCAKNSSSNAAASVTDYLEGASSNISLTLPTMSTHQRHNVTIPAAHHRDLSNSTTFDVNKSLSELSSPGISHRRPSFNAEVFSASSKRLSLSVCESNRSRSCMSPFYSARTMYGGASALLPYSSQSTGRLRSASTSKLNVFSPKNQITIQPVPSPSKGANDQETMSTAARRILDTLEKYCSPVKDAKRIPVNESPSKNEDDRPFTPRGVKRKLPALAQIMPSTADLLRIKRQEKMQDSVMSARQAVSSVPETLLSKDGDSSSDSADLDYSARTEDPIANESSQRFKGKLKRKDANKFDDRPPAPLKLPNAVLKISNLPKFNITDQFTFSRPILPENMDAVREEENVTKSHAGSAASSNVTSTTNKTFKDDGKRTDSSGSLTDNKWSSKPHPSKGVHSENTKSFSPSGGPRFNAIGQKANQQCSNVDKFLPIVSKNNRWTCQKCLLENTSESCSSCSSSRPSKETKKSVTTNQTVGTIDRKTTDEISLITSFGSPEVTKTGSISAKTSIASSDVSNTNNNRNNSVNDDIAKSNIISSGGDGESKKIADVDRTDSKVPDKTDGTAKPSNDANPSALWKNLQTQPDDTWKCDICWIKNKKSDAKCVACGEPNSAAAATEEKTDVPKPTFKFGIDKCDTNVSAAASTAAPVSSIGINFGFGNASSATSSAASSSTFTMPSFGEASKTMNFAFSNANAAATSVADGEKTKPATQPTFTFGIKKTEPTTSPTNSFKMTSPIGGQQNSELDSAPKTSENVIFNDVSSSTNNKKNSSFFKPAADFGTDSVPKMFKMNLPKDTNSFGVAENGDETKPAAAFNDITSSTEAPNKKKTVSFASFFNKDATGLSNNVVGSNGIGDGEFKMPVANNATTAVSSSNSNMFAPNFSSSTVSFMSNSKPNEVPGTGMFSSPIGGAAATTNNGNTNENSIFHAAGASATTSAIGSTFGLSNAVGKNDAAVPNDPNKTNNIFATVNHSNFGVSSSQPANTVFGSFSSLDHNLNKIPEANAAATATGAVASPNPVNAVPAFRFGMNAPTNAQPSGGFAFNGPKMENATPKFGFGASTNNLSFGGGGSQFSFGSTAQPVTSDALSSGSVFSSGLKMAQADGQLSAPAKAPPAFGGANLFGAAATDTVKKSGGFNFSGFGGANVNDNQDANRLNNSNAAPVPAFVFGSASNQPPQQHNFNMTIPSTFNFTAGGGGGTGNAITSFIAQPSSNQPARKIKKAVRRTNK